MPAAITPRAASTPDKPPRRRWRWPVALKVFGGILVVLGAYSGWIVWRGYRQLVAIEKIEDLGGAVEVRHVGPDWLRRSVGDDHMRALDSVQGLRCKIDSPDPQLFREIGKWPEVSKIEIFFGDWDTQFWASDRSKMKKLLSKTAKRPSAPETGFASLRHLSRLQKLGVCGPLVTDSGWESIEFMENLVELSLCYCPITDSTAFHFTNLKRLENLEVEFTLITDDGLKHISNLTNLTRLDLTGTRITDAGLMHLQKLTNLQYLDLEVTDVTDIGLVKLAGLSNIQTLGLADTQISDAGLTHLSPFRDLRTLNLINTKITDAGITRLQTLTQLKTLQVYDTKVTAEGVKKLKLALPQLDVWW